MDDSDTERPTAVPYVNEYGKVIGIAIQHYYSIIDDETGDEVDCCSPEMVELSFPNLKEAS